MVPSLSSSFIRGARSPLRTAVRSLREKRWRSSVRWPGRLSNWSSTLSDTHTHTHTHTVDGVLLSLKILKWLWNSNVYEQTSYSLAKRQVLKRFFMWKSRTLKTWNNNMEKTSNCYFKRSLTDAHSLIHDGRNGKRPWVQCPCLSGWGPQTFTSPLYLLVGINCLVTPLNNSDQSPYRSCHLGHNYI